MKHVRIVGSLSLAAALVAGCIQIPSVVLVPIPPTNGSPAAPAPPVDPPVVVPPVVVDPPATPEPAPLPLLDLELFVLDGAGVAIPTGQATIPASGETRHVSDGAGRIHFAVRGSVVVEVSAPGYRPATRNVPPGRHNVNLESLAPPAPAVVPGPSVGSVAVACGVEGNRTGISQACVDAVAAVSAFANVCRITGAAEPCNYVTREVAAALRDHDERWGLIRKTAGGDNVDGYGVDVVAYLPKPLALDVPTWRWQGADIIGGLGLPNARLIGGKLHRVLNCDTTPKEEIGAEGWCNRTADVWAPVPKR